MDYKSYPISITSPSWEIYIKVCQEELGFSPTRGLDEAGLPIKSPAAFLSTLSLDNHPKQALTRDSRIFDHVSMGFIFIIDDLGLIYIYDNLSPLHIMYRSGDHCVLVFVTGTIRLWKQAIIRSCNQSIPRVFRKMLNNVYENFVAGGFLDIFNGYEKYPLFDDTFELR